MGRGCCGAGGEAPPSRPESADTWEVTVFVIVMGIVIFFAMFIIYRCEAHSVPPPLTLGVIGCAGFEACTVPHG